MQYVVINRKSAICNIQPQLTTQSWNDLFVLADIFRLPSETSESRDMGVMASQITDNATIYLLNDFRGYVKMIKPLLHYCLVRRFSDDMWIPLRKG